VGTAAETEGLKRRGMTWVVPVAKVRREAVAAREETLQRAASVAPLAPRQRK
jgi:hypothetical protein